MVIGSGSCDMTKNEAGDGGSHDVPVPVLLERARLGNTEALGQVLQLYRNYLTILATTQLDRRLRRRVNPSDLVQDAMLAAHTDFAAFRGRSERELLAWLRQILINCLHHVVETHLRAKMRDMRRRSRWRKSGPRWTAPPAISPRCWPIMGLRLAPGAATRAGRGPGRPAFPLAAAVPQRHRLA